MNSVAQQARLALESVEISALQSAKYLMDVCAALQPAAAPAAPTAREDKVAPDQLTFPSARATTAAAAVPPPVEEPSLALADGAAHVVSVANAAKVVAAMRAPAPALVWPAYGTAPQPQLGSAWRGAVPQQAAGAVAAGPSLSPPVRSSNAGAGLASPSAQPARPSGAPSAPAGAGGAGGAAGAAAGGARTPVMAELASFLRQQGPEAGVSSEAGGGGEGSGQRAPGASSSFARDGGGSGAASGAASSASSGSGGGGGGGGGTAARAPSGLVLDSGGQAGAQASAAPQPWVMQAVERLRADARPGGDQAEAAALAQGGGMPRAPHREDGIERHARRRRAGGHFEKSLSGSLSMVEL